MTNYKAICHHRNGKTEFIGTIPELVQKFSYTLKAGNSWDCTINTNPKTAKGLENALNKSAAVRRCYSEYYEISKK